jgi:hypothetical protein
MDKRWLIGYVGTWFILAAMADIDTTADLASALAISIAVAASFALGPEAAKNLKS